MARDHTAREFEPERVVAFEKKKRARDRNEDGDRSRFFTSDERREAVGFLLMAIAVVLFLSLILNPSELRGVASSEKPAAAGLFGRWIATQIGILFGFGGLVIPLALGAWGLAIFQDRPQKAIFAKGLALVVGLIAVCAGLGLVWDRGYLGGALGDRLSSDLYQTFGLVSYVVVFFTLALSLVIGTPLSFSALGALIAAGAVKAWAYGVALEQKIVERLRASRERNHEPQPAAAGSLRAARTQNAATSGASIESVDPETGEIQGREYFDKAETRVISTPVLKLVGRGKKKRDDDGAPVENPEPGPVHGEKASAAGSANAESEKGAGAKPEATTESARASVPPLAAVTSTTSRPADPARPADAVQYTPLEAYTLPSLSTLADPKPATETITEDDLKRKAQMLQDTLSDHGITCKIGDIVPGPTVTRFEVIPAPGVKVSSIQARADDISLAMAAPSIRIEAPIPNKSAVGIEIPNRKGHMVTLKEVIVSDEFKRLRETSPLTVALGQDIAGQPVVVDLRKMPHLLIAGATGSGKSVCLNAIINSILLSAKPTEVRLMMVDPKVVELKSYDDIPHLLAPVVTDARKAPRVLQWLVEEMERRYQYLARAGVRDIESFNALAADAPAADPGEPDDFIDFEDEAPSAADLPRKMPFILAIIDEFGDLMVIAKKECEDYIMRIVQMARAVGIHLIIATQRPSVNVITGVIKANMPSRLSFQVSSKVDSMTILDTMGAERLLGRGDMLFKPGDKPKPQRLQGVFISTPEINAVIKHYADQGPARREVVLNPDEATATQNALAGEDDPLLEQAMRIALADGMASVSRLQRKLQVGHPRASRLVDIMEAKGLVTPPDGSKPRKLLFDASYFGEGGEQP